jgi:CubicO group peptidase (beta-lactamase class C family)/peptidoglycan/xylan/chitin deacetylase (PgdA/CDA1 family)
VAGAHRRGIVVVVALLAGAMAAGPTSLRAGTRLAVTIDDLPWVGETPPEETKAHGLERIAAVLKVHGAPATGFVVCDAAAGERASLDTWLEYGFDLGNHTASHRNLDHTPLEEWLAAAARCDAFLRNRGAGYAGLFRFPMLHRGSNAERRDAARAGLARLGLTVVPVSVDTSDWILARAYDAALLEGEALARRAIGRVFLRHVAEAEEHAEGVARRKLGREVPQILLLHASALVADHLDGLLRRLEARGVRFIGVDEALADPAYALADGYVGPKGLSWLYRMVPASPEDASWDDGWSRALLAAFPAQPRRREDRPAPGDASRHITHSWVSSALPVAQARALRGAVELAAGSERMQALLVMHRGQLVAEAYFNGVDADTPQNLKSVTKSLTSALVGVALDRGWIRSLDDPVARYLPEHFAEGRHADKAGITIRNLLTMTSGLAPVGYGAFQDSEHWVETLLDSPVRAPSGRDFLYDTPAVHLLTAILTRVSGVPARDLANRYLLGPLGTELVGWRRGPQGIDMGGNDAFLRPRGLIRLGELYRLGGLFQGRRLLSAEFVRESIRHQVDVPEPTVNHGTLAATGYGLLWWLLDFNGEPAFAALGHGGQELVIFPSRELVVLLTSRWPGTSSVEHYRLLARVLREGVLPAFSTAGGRPKGVGSGALEEQAEER